MSGSKELALTVGSRVAIDAQIQVVTPKSANIFIPFQGLDGNDPTMEVHPQTLHPKPITLNRKQSALNPKP